MTAAPRRRFSVRLGIANDDDALYEGVPDRLLRPLDGYCACGGRSSAGAAAATPRRSWLGSMSGV